MSELSSSKPEESLTRKERERLARRAEIIAAAANVFGEKGFGGATLDEIAERAEFGKGTLYNYFASKEELYEATVRRLLDDLHAIAADACTQDLTTRECFAEYTLRAVLFYREHYAFCQTAMVEHFRRTVEGSPEACQKENEKVDRTVLPLVKRLQQGMDAGEIRKGDAPTLVHLFAGLIDHYYMHLTFEQLSMTENEMKQQVDMLVSVFFDGVADSTPNAGAQQ